MKLGSTLAGWSAAGCEFEDQRAIDARVEAPVERVERLTIAKVGALDASLYESVSAPLQFIMHEQGEKVDGPEVLRASLLCADCELVCDAA